LEQNLAILIDFENIATGTDREGMGKFDIRLVMNRFKDKGRILVARSYADWGRYAKFKQDLLMQNVSLFELTSHGMQDKNRADVALVVDCMELAFTKDYVDTFVIISGDSDFTPLVLKLKEMNKRVIGCGTRRSTSRLIVEACDEFIFYDTLKKARRASSRDRDDTRKPDTNSSQGMTRPQAFDLMVDTLEGLMRESTEAVPASVLKQAMLRKEPAFSENDLGYSSFGRFLEACRDRGMIRLSRDGKAGSYRVEAPNGDEEDTSASTRPQVHELEGAPAGLYAQLAGVGLAPLTPELRELVLAALIDVVADRAKRGLKSTVRYVHQDVFKSVMGANPKLASSHVKSVVKGLQVAGLFLHTADGRPVRSQTAGFELAEGLTPSKLMDKLAAVYVSALRELNVDMTAAAADAAEVIYDDREKARQIQELAAWDALNDSQGQETEDVAPPSAPEARPSRRTRQKPRAEEVEAAPVEAKSPAGDAVTEARKAPEVAAVAPVEEPPKKTTRRRKPRRRSAGADTPSAAPATSAAATPAPADVAPPAEAPVEAKAAPAAAPVGAAAEATAQAPAEAAAVEPAPKKRATRRRVTTKKADPKTETAEKKPAAKTTKARTAAKKTTTRKPAAKKTTTAKKTTAAKKPAAKKTTTRRKSATTKAASKTTASKTAAKKAADGADSATGDDSAK